VRISIWKGRRRLKPRKSFTPEQGIAKQRHIEVALSNRETLRQACNEAAISPSRTIAGARGTVDCRACTRRDSGISSPRTRERRSWSRNGYWRRRCSRSSPPLKLVSPERRRRAATLLQRRFGVTERRACAVASRPRAVQRYIPTVRADKDALTQAIVAFAAEYGRYGYRRVHVAGSRLSHADGVAGRFQSSSTAQFVGPSDPSEFAQRGQTRSSETAKRWFRPDALRGGASGVVGTEALGTHSFAEACFPAGHWRDTWGQKWGETRNKRGQASY